MTDRERLIELIRCASFHPVEGVRATIGSRFTSEFIEDIASHLIANGVTIDSAPQWIPVTDRLPETEGRCLCVKRLGKSGSVYVTVMNGDSEGFSMEHIYSDDVTHWMPLPEPPEMDGKENNNVD